MLIANPRPVPPKRFSILLSSWENSSKTFSFCSFEIPIPVSFTSIHSTGLFLACRSQAFTTTLPSGVNLQALLTRFVRICFILKGSVITGRSSSGAIFTRTSTSRGFSGGIALSTVSSIRFFGLKASSSIDIFPASNLERSSRSFTSRKR